MKIQVGDKTLNISKWKGKTKKEFVRLLKDEIPDEIAIMNTLVYSNIEEDVILSPSEFRYVLSRIRAISIGEELEMEFYCDKCEKVFKRTLLLNEIIKTSYKKLTEIKVEGARIKLGPIKNKEIYQKLIDEDPDFDFLLRIERINGNSTFTVEQLQEIIDDLDVDILENVMEIFNDHKFKIDDINTITCDCKNEMLFEFDELPGFFPETWFSEE